MVWRKAGSTTLETAGDNLDITSLSVNKFNQFMTHTFATVNKTRLNYTTDNSSGGTDYCWVHRVNGAGTGNSALEGERASFNANASTSTDDNFEVIYGANITGEEKLFILRHMQNNGTGVNAPDRTNLWAKKDTTTTSAQYTSIECTNDSSGDYAIGSNISALGSDGVESLNVQDGAVYYETDTNKEYVLYDNTWTEL